MDRQVAEWITADAPHLRIVPNELWSAAHARLAETRSAYLRATDGSRYTPRSA